MRIRPSLYGTNLLRCQVIISDGGPALVSQITAAIAMGIYGKAVRRRCYWHGVVKMFAAVYTPARSAKDGGVGHIVLRWVRHICTEAVTAPEVLIAVKECRKYVNSVKLPDLSYHNALTDFLSSVEKIISELALALTAGTMALHCTTTGRSEAENAVVKLELRRGRTVVNLYQATRRVDQMRQRRRRDEVFLRARRQPIDYETCAEALRCVTPSAARQLRGALRDARSIAIGKVNENEYLARHCGGTASSVGQVWSDYKLYPVSAALGQRDAHLSRSKEGKWICEFDTCHEGGLPCMHLCALFKGDIRAIDVHPRFLNCTQFGSYDEVLKMAGPWAGLDKSREPPHHSKVSSLPSMSVAVAAALGDCPGIFYKGKFPEVQAKSVPTKKTILEPEQPATDLKFCINALYLASQQFEGAEALLVTRITDVIEEIHDMAHAMQAKDGVSRQTGVIDYPASKGPRRKRHKGPGEKTNC